MRDDVTVVVINYNGKRYLEKLLQSLSHAGDYDTILVDNGSWDGSVDFVKENYPWVNIIPLGGNYGHSKACNVGLKEAKTKWVCFLDHDVVVTKGWMDVMLRAVKDRPDVGIVFPRVVFYDDKETIHSDGGYIHYIGRMVLRNGFSSIRDSESGSCEVRAGITASMLVDRKKAWDVGMFDEDIFIGYSDLEFSMKIGLCGYKCLSTPSSIVYHMGGSPGFSYRSSKRYPRLTAYYMIRNRWLIILKLYSAKTIFVCLPAFLIYEGFIFVGVLKRGLLKEYILSIWWILKHLHSIIMKRKKVQLSRKVLDKELLEAKRLTFSPGLMKNRLERIGKGVLDSFLIWYWSIIRRLL